MADPAELLKKIAELDEALNMRPDGLLGPTPEHRAIIRARRAELHEELAAAIAAMKEPT